MTKDTPKNIYAALLEIQSDLPVVPKRREADTGKYRYSFADIADLTAAVLPRLVKLGVVYVCEPEVVFGQQGTEQGLRGRLVHVESDTEVQGTLVMKGVRTAQEVGSGLTYYRRYLMGCLTGVLTDNDEDGTIASKVSGQAIEEEINAAKTSEEVASIARDRNLSGILRSAALKRHAELKAAEDAEN